MGSTALHAFLVRSNEHTVESLIDTLVNIHLDEIWFRISLCEELRWPDDACFWIELYRLQDGMPVLPEALGFKLSESGRVALRLSMDSTHTSIAYELFENGRPKSVWVGDRTRYQSDDDGDEKKSTERNPELEFAEDFSRIVGLSFDAILGAEIFSEPCNEEARRGTMALVRGRLVELQSGMGRWPELFHFHDRNASSETGDDESDHLAIVALDLKATERLWKRTPAGQVYQFLRHIEPYRRSVLGPLGQLLPEAIAAIESLPPEQPLASAAQPNLLVYEVLAMSTALIYMVGDRLDYLDERFFPLLSLDDAPVSTTAIHESADEISEMGVLSAMTETMPYLVPEGQVMDSIADEEMAPLASWAVREGAYEGSLFLLDGSRLKALIESFRIDRFEQRIQAFRKTWFETLDTPEPREQWLGQRQMQDEMEQSRFEDTFVELSYAFKLAEINHLDLALLFYSR